MKQLITFLFCLFTLFAEAQNTNDTTKYFKSYDYGFSYRRLQAREAFIMPTDTVINKLGAVSLNGAIYLGNGIKWTSIGGGVSTDTTSLSNRINLKIDSLKRSNDSVYAYRNGTRVFQYKDSVGISTDTTSLSNRINKKIDSLKRSSDSVYAFINGVKTFQFKDSVGGGGGDFWKTSGTTTLTGGIRINGDGFLQFAGDEDEMSKFGVSAINFDLALQGGNFSITGLNTTTDTSTYKPLGIDAGTGKLAPVTSWVSGGVAVDTIFRKLGKDSIFYKNNNITYAIKDSVGVSIDTTSLSNRINLKLNISDTAAMLSSYAKNNLVATKLNATDTASLSNRINLKLNIIDTSVLQRKSISAYTILANNTNATANATSQNYKDTSGTYTGTITWSGTAPTSGTFTYRWLRIGRMVTINITLVYAVVGATNQQLVVTLPADAPTPTKPSGLTSASNMLYPALAQINATNQNTLTSSTMRCMLRSNSANNGFEFFMNCGSLSTINAFITCTYFTD